jgi:hypothetical protein
VRLAYNLFTQKPKGEKADFLNWTKTTKYKQGDDYFRHNGGGESRKPATVLPVTSQASETQGL